MANMARSQDFKTVKCRLSFAQGLYKARAQKNSTKLKHQVTLIFPKAARAALEAEIAKVIIEEWGDKGITMAKQGMIKSPILPGDGKEARYKPPHKQAGELQPGMGPDVIFIRPQAGVDRPPWVRWKDPNTQETEKNVYSGCYGKGVVNLFAWKNDEGGLGVSFGIQGFQKLEEGERLGGGGQSNAEDWVETIEDDGPAPDSTRTGQGAAGLFGA